MLLNLFVAVVLNQYTRSLAISRSYVRDEHIDAFTAAWAEVDPTGSGFMPASRVYEFLIGTCALSSWPGPNPSPVFAHARRRTIKKPIRSIGMRDVAPRYFREVLLCSAVGQRSGAEHPSARGGAGDAEMEPPLGIKCDWRKMSRARVTAIMRGFHIPVYRTPAGTKMECFEGDTFFVAFKVRLRSRHATESPCPAHTPPRPSPALLAGPAKQTPIPFSHAPHL